MMQDRKLFAPGTLVQHFKRTLLTDDQITEEPMKYLYEIVGIAEDTENGQELMIYRALYGDGRLYARPLDMFFSPVDRAKYPDAVQEYRFMPVS